MQHFLETKTIYGAVVVMRDDSGRFMKAKSLIFHGILDAKEAEALGLL